MCSILSEMPVLRDEKGLNISKWSFPRGDIELGLPPQVAVDTSCSPRNDHVKDPESGLAKEVPPAKCAHVHFQRIWCTTRVQFCSSFPLPQLLELHHSQHQTASLTNVG